MEFLKKFIYEQINKKKYLKKKKNKEIKKKMIEKNFFFFQKKNIFVSIFVKLNFAFLNLI